MLSVVLATHNEGKNIARCLKAVKEFADEIIIVDGESTDDTVSLARSFGATVISTTNKPNFHINKQMAMDKAKGDLVLQLDADEVVDAELARFIKKNHAMVMSEKKAGKASTLPAAWYLKRKNLFLGHFFRKSGQYPDPVIRLYRKGLARLPQKDVHEQMDVKGEVAWAEGHLLHYANPTFDDYLRKWNAYTSLKASQLHEQGLKMSLVNTIDYCFIKPIYTFGLIFVRHKGFIDGWAGFVFSLMSGIYFLVSYLKLWEMHERTR